MGCCAAQKPVAIKRGMRETLHLQEQRRSGTRLKIALAELRSYLEHLEAVTPRAVRARRAVRAPALALLAALPSGDPVRNLCIFSRAKSPTHPQECVSVGRRIY